MHEDYDEVIYREALCVVLAWAIVQANKEYFFRILRQEENAPAGAESE